jgi:RES domain
MTQGFASWRSYRKFRQEIAREYRHFWSSETKQFLDTLAVDSRARVGELAAGRFFYRAQVAHDFDSDGVPSPADPVRMTPQANRAREGRVNSKGIPRLYMAADMHTAMAECRPWVGSMVSVGVFETARNLRIVDCTSDRKPSFYFSVFKKDYEPPAEEIEEAVWRDVAHAFREPVTRDDDVADYAPTQVIAELFRRERFDGIGYRSAFGTDRFNVALFDVTAARLHKCSFVRNSGR